MWSLTGVRQNKMNVKARTDFHMLFWELWEGLNQFPHGKAAAHIPSGIFLFSTHLPKGLQRYRTTPWIPGATTRMYQEPESHFMQAAVPVCTVTKLHLGCSLMSMTQGRSLWPDLFLLQPLLYLSPEASMRKVRFGLLLGCIHLFLSSATGSCLLATNTQQPKRWVQIYRRTSVTYPEMT